MPIKNKTLSLFRTKKTEREPHDPELIDSNWQSTYMT